MKRIRNNGLWVFCETQAGQLLPVGLQLLGKARSLADQGNLPLYAVVLGPMPDGGTEQLKASGADDVLWADGPALADKL